MTYSKFPLLNKKKTENVSIENYKSKYNVEELPGPFIPGSGLKSLLFPFSKVSDGNKLKKIIKKIRSARNRELPIVFSLKSEVIDEMLSPFIIDLMQRGWISAISIDEDFLIKDFELALSGRFIRYEETSLDPNVDQSIAEETGLFLNIAYKEGEKRGMGAGEAVGDYLSRSKFKYNEYSIIANCYKLNIPVTVHSAYGSNKIHYHSNFEGKVYGSLLERDFILYSSIISKMTGSVYISFGFDRIEFKILKNALNFCSVNSINPNGIMLCIAGDVHGFSLKYDKNMTDKKNRFSIVRIGVDTSITLPLITGLLLEEI